MKWSKRPLGETDAPDVGKTAREPEPEQAWKLLDHIDGWIRHSDSKAGVTLAFVGVLATMLFNLVKNFAHRTVLFDVLVVLAALFIVMAAAYCAWTLTPRTDDAESDPESVNRLFFGSIASGFRGKRPQYRDALTSLVADPAELTRELADQIHANARIATVKAKAAKRAIRSALAAGATVAVLATIVGISSL